MQTLKAPSFKEIREKKVKEKELKQKLDRILRRPERYGQRGTDLDIPLKSGEVIRVHRTALSETFYLKTKKGQLIKVTPELISEIEQVLKEKEESIALASKPPLKENGLKPTTNHAIDKVAGS